MFAHFGFSPPNLRLPGEQNCTQDGRTERKGDGKLRAPVRPLAYKRLPRQPALSQTMQGNTRNRESVANSRPFGQTDGERPTSSCKKFAHLVGSVYGTQPFKRARRFSWRHLVVRITMGLDELKDREPDQWLYRTTSGWLTANQHECQQIPMTADIFHCLCLFQSLEDLVSKGEANPL